MRRSLRMLSGQQPEISLPPAAAAEASGSVDIRVRRMPWKLLLALAAAAVGYGELRATVAGHDRQLGEIREDLKDVRQIRDDVAWIRGRMRVEGRGARDEGVAVSDQRSAVSRK